jgi:hypothetical protein
LTYDIYSIDIAYIAAWKIKENNLRWSLFRSIDPAQGTHACM